MSSGKGYFDNSSFEATPYIFEKRLEYSGKTWSSIATSFLFQSEHSSTKANLYLVKFLRANVFSSEKLDIENSPKRIIWAIINESTESFLVCLTYIFLKASDWIGFIT